MRIAACGWSGIGSDRLAGFDRGVDRTRLECGVWRHSGNQHQGRCGTSKWDSSSSRFYRICEACSDRYGDGFPRGSWIDERVELSKKHTNAFWFCMGGHRGEDPTRWKVVASWSPVGCSEHAHLGLCQLLTWRSRLRYDLLRVPTWFRPFLSANPPLAGSTR